MLSAIRRKTRRSSLGRRSRSGEKKVLAAQSLAPRRLPQILEEADEPEDLGAGDQSDASPCVSRPGTPDYATDYSSDKSELSDMSLTELESLRPVSIEDFEIDEGGEIGSGGFGKVFAARNMVSNRRVALKVSQVDQGLYENEVAAMRAVGSHPYVVRLFSSFSLSDDYTRAIEMELAEGVDLFDYLSLADIDRSEIEAARIFRCIATAIAHCHFRGVCHRDVKPENIMISRQPNEPLSVKLIDFGLAQVGDIDNCEMGCGSVDFAAPEVVLSALHKNAPYSGRLADSWSLGIVLFQLVTWRYPFQREERVEAIRDGRPQPKIHFSSKTRCTFEYKDLVRRLTREDPERRMAVADALRHPWMFRRPEENSVLRVL
jgi:serine/threonine protein kinase